MLSTFLKYPASRKFWLLVKFKKGDLKASRVVTKLEPHFVTQINIQTENIIYSS